MIPGVLSSNQSPESFLLMNKEDFLSHFGFLVAKKVFSDGVNLDARV